MRIWIDDKRPPIAEYTWVRSVNQAKDLILESEITIAEIDEKEQNIWNSVTWEDCTLRRDMTIELIDMDHDAGEYADDGGDYIKLLDWFEETGRNYPIKIHSMNPVGAENMRRIIRRNDWTEVRK